MRDELDDILIGFGITEELGLRYKLKADIKAYLKRKIEAIDSKWLPIDKKEMILKALGV
jgi:hypothetical protein